MCIVYLNTGAGIGGGGGGGGGGTKGTCSGKAWPPDNNASSVRTNLSYKSLAAKKHRRKCTRLYSALCILFIDFGESGKNTK